MFIMCLKEFIALTSVYNMDDLNFFTPEGT